MNNIVTTAVGMQSNLTRSTQEAMKLAYRLGFRQQPDKKEVERLISDKTQALNVLDGGALFCWDCDPPD